MCNDCVQLAISVAAINQRNQSGGEIFDQFYSRLVKLSANCNFAKRDNEI